MLEFYYDFLGRYFDRGDFELIHMDTDRIFCCKNTTMFVRNIERSNT